ncbi:hypothetical protein ABIE28_002027 [Devosia sp. 2618]
MTSALSPARNCPARVRGLFVRAPTQLDECRISFRRPTTFYQAAALAARKRGLSRCPKPPARLTDMRTEKPPVTCSVGSMRRLWARPSAAKMIASTPKSAGSRAKNAAAHLWFRQRLKTDGGYSASLNYILMPMGGLPPLTSLLRPPERPPWSDHRPCALAPRPSRSTGLSPRYEHEPSHWPPLPPR